MPMIKTEEQEMLGNLRAELQTSAKYTRHRLDTSLAECSCLGAHSWSECLRLKMQAPMASTPGFEAQCSRDEPMSTEYSHDIWLHAVKTINAILCFGEPRTGKRLMRLQLAPDHIPHPDPATFDSWAENAKRWKDLTKGRPVGVQKGVV